VILETASGDPTLAFAVPDTLQGLLMARLDRLGPAAKDVAQTGAAIGREFGYGLLASSADLSEERLREALDQLASAGLLFVRGRTPEASYRFKHALVQDVAYGALLRDQRRGLHARIVTSLEERFPEVVSAQPALLAQHCEAAGLAEKAVGYWLKAGQQALARSASAEAVAQLEQGLRVLATLPDGLWRQEQELELRIPLGTASIAAKGFSVADVGETFARARVLAERLDRPELLAPLFAGQFSFLSNRSEHLPALSLGEELEQIGEVRNDVTAQLRGRHLQGATLFFLGRFEAARAVQERCVNHADTWNRAAAFVDPNVSFRIWLAMP
jgi:hypothetical protein